MLELPPTIEVESEATDHLYQLIQTITMGAMAKSDGTQINAIQLGVTAVTAALTGMAAIVGQREGVDSHSSKEDQWSTVNDASMLVAALIVVRATSGHNKSFHMEMNPIVYLAAIKAAETILGKNIDSLLNPGLVGAARRWENEYGYAGSWNASTYDNVVGERPSRVN